MSSVPARRAPVATAPRTGGRGLDARQLDVLFPFHLRFDAALRVRDFGPSLPRAVPGCAPGRPLAELFEPPGTMGEHDVARWRAIEGQSLTLRTHAGVALRGQVMAEDEGFLFAGAPAFNRIEELQAAGLDLEDFAAHDPIADFMFVQRANVMAFEDARRLARRLREKSSKLAAIFDAAPGCIVSFNAAGQVDMCSAPTREILGVECEQLRGMDAEGVAALLVPCANEPDRLHRWITHSDDTADLRFELLAPRRTLQGMRRLAGDGTQVVFFRDLTQLMAVDRMKNEFLSMAAHELRTPMVSIVGFVELLLARRFDEKRAREMLEIVHRQGRLMTDLISELLDLTRLEAKGDADFCLGDHALAPLLDDTLAALQVPASHPVVVEAASGLPPARIDPAKFQQALRNVLSNAIKYSPEGGEVRITVTREGDHLAVAVRDRGIGMTPAQMTHLFERFWRADTSGRIPGTGLGMAIVKHILELLRGGVDVESQPGAGTCVKLRVPVSRD